MENKTNKVKWYESGHVITSLLILVILATIFCSQSFAVVSDSGFSIFTSVINHNSLYLVVLIYFVLLKTKGGKKYFNYLNIFLMFFYFIAMITSFLTLIQSFTLNPIIDFLKNLVLVIYLIHTFFRDTRIWKEYRLGRSPFNEITNETYYYALIVLVVFNLVINLISTVVISGLFISVLDAIYLLLFGRYIYLYREYLDYHDLDSHNEGNFDDIRDGIAQNSAEIRHRVDEVLDKTDIDDKIVEATKKIKKRVSKKKTEEGEK